MRRVCVIIGILVFVVAAAGLWHHPEGWSSASAHMSRTLHLLQPPPPAEHQPIPALPSSPRLFAPLWFVYAGSAASLLVAAIMLWRCHAAGRCRCMRKLTRVWRE